MQQTLADQFGYIPMRVDLVVACTSGAAKQITTGTIKFNQICRYDCANYMLLPINDHQHRLQEMCVLLIELTPTQIAVMQVDSRMTVLMFDTYEHWCKKTIINTVGKYPKYLQDSNGVAMSLSGTSAMQIFNSDTNKWLSRTSKISG